MTVVTRFPPSPTGFLHIGSARTALYNWLYARRFGGTFVLRMEDTDRERSTDEAVEAILSGMKWLELDWDEGPYFQTQRFDRYKEVVAQLLDEGKAYRCYCTAEEVEAMRDEARQRGEKPKYNGYWRDRDAPPPKGVDPVIRFKNPLAGDVVIDDAVHGEVRVANSELDDLIIARADGTPTYHLSVVVDDIDMGITHVIRGNDHMNNTPRQVNILEALGAQRPVYAHLPMIVGADGKRLSKRHGAVDVSYYREQGILPEALLNYLARLGWSHGDQELFTREEMIALFDISGVNKAPAGYDDEKLKWVNHQKIMHGKAAAIASAAMPFLAAAGLDPDAGPPLSDAVRAFRERAETLVEFADKVRPYYADFEEFDEKAAKKHLRPVAAPALEKLKEKFAAVEDWHGERLHAIVEETAAELELGMGKVGQPLRVAVTGTGQSPGIDVTLELVGRERTLARIDRALRFIAERS